MSREAESRLSYLTDMLNNAEFYLENDQRVEEQERKVQEERERLAAE